MWRRRGACGGWGHGRLKIGFGGRGEGGPVGPFRPRVVFFIFFAECPLGRALGKICFYFFLKNFAECHLWALGKMFFYFLKTNFAECLLGPALGKDIFAECSPWHSAKYIFFFILDPNFFV